MGARTGHSASALSIAALVGGLAACSSTSTNTASGGTSGSSGATATGGSAGGGTAGATSSGGSAGTSSTGGSGGTTATGGSGGAAGAAGSSCTEPPSAPSGNCANPPVNGSICSAVGTCCAMSTLFQCKCDAKWHETKSSSQCCPSNPAAVGDGKSCSTAADVVCCSTAFQGFKCSGGKWAATGIACP
ncbi:MAG: hypothetical protein IPM35_06265 [Myxococcales bacterium]|nr:hypothetical protein [Myxococcales bacterium]